MIILPDFQMGEAEFTNEQEIEDVVLANSEQLFGPSSVLIPKARIRTRDGAGTIPDGFAVDLDSRRWYIMEAELQVHSVWSHIAPQVSKQLLASRLPETRKLLVEIIMSMYRDDTTVQEKFDELGIDNLDVHGVLEEVLETEPIVAIPIDKIRADLREWTGTLRSDVRLWVVRKFVKLDDPDVVAYEIPEQFSPEVVVIEQGETKSDDESGVGHVGYGVSVLDLINADMVAAGDQVTMRYGPRHSRKKKFTATIMQDGNIEIDEHRFTSLSYAAVYCIQAAGSQRKTVNGWTSWRAQDGRLLSEIRDEYIARHVAMVEVNQPPD